MLKAVLVEDEPALLRHLRSMIEGQGILDVIGVAANGADALELIKRSQPDVVITDIKMPVLGGIEMIERAKELGLGISFVIVSGYGEFSFARSAVRLGVVDYLLKPVSEVELRCISERLRGEAAEARRKTDLAVWKASLAGDAIEARPPSGAPFVAVLACLGPFLHAEDEAFVPPAAAAVIDELAVRLQSGSKGPSWVLRQEARNSLLAIFPSAAMGASKDAWAGLLEECAPASGTTLTALISRELAEVSPLRDEYRRLRERMPWAVMPGKVVVECIRDPVSEPHSRVEDPILNKAFASLCRRAGSESVRREIVSLLSEEMGRSSPQARLVELFDSLYAIAGANRPGLGAPVPQTVARARLIELLFDSRGLPSFPAKAADLFIPLLETSRSPKGREELIGEVDAFLEDHLAEPISLEDLGNLFNLDPNYLSRIYKNATGLSPVGRVATLRIERAIELMRAKPELLVKDVSELVGYEDQAYFTKVFKRIKGCHPSEYRRDILSIPCP